MSWSLQTDGRFKPERSRSEILLFVPSIANFRLAWLKERLGTAAAVSVVLLQADHLQSLSRSLQDDVLMAMGAKAIAVRDAGVSRRRPGGALYEAFPPAEARRILRRLEFHYMPKHASWLNMVEIEIGVLNCECLDRRIDNAERLSSEIAAWERQRNAAGARIDWMFTTDKARAKMGRAYPQVVKESESL